MLIEKDKLKRFLEDGHVTFFYYELKHGYQWRRTLDDLHAFDQVCKRLNKEIRKNVNARKEELLILTQIQEHKNIVWMEGPLSLTTWMDVHFDVLH